MWKQLVDIFRKNDVLQQERLQESIQRREFHLKKKKKKKIVIILRNRQDVTEMSGRSIFSTTDVWATRFFGFQSYFLIELPFSKSFLFRK